ncbi:FadR family transcriptional regulator [Lysinibacillus yapensis]|uniref:FadR family transcriptional regulator n=1 Tax=Ureibacillus yapensis TaxID=2304605 RepID=A0A396SAI5_9BACL|nr:FadR/GntR family transcriptional regulator [Lysinibacillus yapensis]RHW38348.1 FadR family transcriptional regulator [Lysinibacillus yapensis]
MAMHNLSDQLVHKLGKQIISEVIPSGAVLPKVEVMSEQYGVSRTVVREALKGLVARRLVKSVPKMGTIICEREEWQWWDPEVLSWACEGEHNNKYFQQLTEMRLAIEPTTAELAAEHATKDDIKDIATCFEKLELSAISNNEKEWASADYDFHQSIMVASHNELLINLGKLLRDALLQSRHKTMKIYNNENEREIPISKEQALLFHKNVYMAICKGDRIEARETMYNLILHVNKILKTYNTEN